VKVTVVGTGYVGLVIGACLAETGNDVICADVDSDKIEGLRHNRLPIHEPGLEPLVVRNQRDGRLEFTTDVGAAIERSDVIFIAVGTPPDEDGSADLQHVLDVARTIGQHMNRSKLIVTKSTVPVGTAERVRAEIAKHATTAFHICANPEFLKEGAAVEDFMKPDRVVLGGDNPEALDAVKELYEPFVRTGNPILIMDSRSAEMSKYASNAILATKISFINEVARLCEQMRADIGEVRRAISLDRRIGPHFIFPGVGYGGSCFPKDIRAMISMGGDEPESALEALAVAIKSAWTREGQRQRHLIVLWTDASAHPLEKANSGRPATYPNDMPGSLNDLTDLWAGQDINFGAKRLIFYAPDADPWSVIGATHGGWENTIWYPSRAGHGLDELRYSEIIDIQKGRHSVDTVLPDDEIGVWKYKRLIALSSLERWHLYCQLQ